jgi:hypothetical protein
MKDIFRILLISLLSFTIISCSKKDESSSSSGSNIQLSNIKANLTDKSLFISTGNKSTYSTTNKSSSTNRSQNRSDSQTEKTSLFVLSSDSQWDYGIISDYKLEIDQLIPYSNNEYAIATLSYGTHLDYESEYNQNIRYLNCGILNIKITNNTISCLANGIVIPNLYDRVIFGYAGKKNEPILIGRNDELFFSNIPDETTFSQSADFKCASSTSCLYKYNPANKTTVKLDEGNDYSQFKLLNNNNIVFKSKPSKVYAGLLLYDESDKLVTLASKTIPDSAANCCTIDPYSSPVVGANISVIDQGIMNVMSITRYENSKIRKTYINVGIEILTYLKSDSGNLYFQNGHKGLYQVLPSIIKVIETPNYVAQNWSTNEYCGGGMSVCGINYMIIDDIIVYTNLDISSGKRALDLKAKRLTDNKTISLVKPDSSCLNNCYTRNNYDYVYGGRAEDAGNSEQEYTRWNVVGKKLYIEVIDLTNKTEKTLVFNFNSIDFSKDNVFEIFDTNGVLDKKGIKDISGLQTFSSNSPTPTATINHEDNNTISVQVEFNNNMDYSDVESKISIIDNATQQAFGFMPVWINKTLHLVADEDNGTVFDNQSNPFLTGHTFKITILGTAKDSDGNALGSDVVKYITP